jgi:hypothetical protein
VRCLQGRSVTTTKANTAASCGNRHQRFFWAKEFFMGWDGSEYEDKKSFVQEILADMGERIVDHAVVGNHLWTVFRGDSSGKLMVGLDLLEKQDGLWYKKSLDESMYPYYFDCPLRLIKAADEPVSETAAEWRKAVEKWHEEKAQERKRAAQLAPGMVVEVSSYRLKLIEHLGRRGWVAASLSNPNSIYRITAAQAKRSCVLGSAA